MQDEFYKDEPIIVLTVEADDTVHDFLRWLDDVAIPHIRSHPELFFQLIFDMHVIQWDFADLMTYISRTIERRKNNPPPMNVNFHFVGANLWVNNWRSMMQRKFNLETTAFKSVEDALEHVRREAKKG